MKKLLIAALVLAAPAFAQDQGKADQNAPSGKPERKKTDISKLPFSADTVKLVVKDVRPAIQDCYNEMLALTKKKVEGQIMTSFVVTPEGMVKDAKVEKRGTTLRNAAFHACVVASLTAMEFPKPADKADHPINFPFKLKAVE